VSAIQIGTRKIRSHKFRTIQVCTSQIGVRKIHTVEIASPEIASGEIDASVRTRMAVDRGGTSNGRARYESDFNAHR
jgi:hypothetical protein